MIRIDLGKGEGKRGGNGLQKLLAGLKLPGGKAPKFLSGLTGGGGGGGKKLGKVTGDAKGLIVISITLAMACLPHLFFTQFQAYVIQEHEARLAKLRESATVLDQEIEKLRPFQKELESYEQQKRLVKERLETVRGLLGNRGTPVNVLDAVGQSLPQRTWLTAVDFTTVSAAPPGGVAAPTDGGGAVHMSGQSYTNEDISDFLDKLGESVHLAEVRLEDVTTGKMDGIDVRLFKVNAVPKGKLGVRRAVTAQPPGATPPGAAQPGAAPVDPAAAVPPPAKNPGGGL